MVFKCEDNYCKLVFYPLDFAVNYIHYQICELSAKFSLLFEKIYELG